MCTCLLPKCVLCTMSMQCLRDQMRVSNSSKTRVADSYELIWGGGIKPCAFSLWDIFPASYSLFTIYMLYIGEKGFFSCPCFTCIHVYRVYRDRDVRQLEDYLIELVLSILWVPGIKLRWSGLVTSAFTQSAVSLAQGNIWFYQFKKKVVFICLLCIYECGVGECHNMLIEIRGQFVRFISLLLSFGPRDQSQVARLGESCLFWLSPAGPGVGF